ncbi:MAG: glycosyltransferase family 2 protein [Infirmifilum sp.]
MTTKNKSDKPLVYIVIVNYNEQHLLRKCLESIFSKTKYPNYKVLVVDNGSNDGSISVARKFPVELIRLRKNVGYSLANNIGIFHALKHGAQYIVLLNNDIEVLDQNWLDLAVRAMEVRPEIGLAGFNLIFPDGASQQYPNITYTTEVRDVAFAAVIIKRDVFLKVGFLSHKDYKLGYAEDNDYCYRARNCGFKVIYIPHIKIVHLRGGTFGKLPRELIFSLRSYNGFKHILINWDVSQLIMWFGFGFLKRDFIRIKWFIHGFIINIISHKPSIVIKLFARRIQRKYFKNCYA